MLTLVMLVGLLLTLVSLLVVGALAYVVHRRPVLTQPVTVALAAAAILIAAVSAIIAAGAR
ncbi:hypothetical protein ACIF80_32985 [Streptomyces sp. NPDC085927]|jgi:phospholipase/lecithinase/hemolysin|uniref:hypothetical protein n=1 Tax=Streptomyces TaxID=1883 RepID=UPI0033B32CFD